MLKQRRLNGEGRFIDKRQPSKRGGIPPFVKWNAVFRQ